MKLYLTVPHDGTIRHEVYALKDAAEAMFRARGWSLIWDPVNDRPTMGCRNNQCNRFLTTPCDRFLTLDSDCLPTRDGQPDVHGLILLMEALDREECAVVGGWSLILDEVRGLLLPCVVGPKGSNPAKPGEWPVDMRSPYASEPLHEVAALGSHVLGFRREVVEAMHHAGRIPFEDLYDRDPRSKSFGCRVRGHDLGFCELARDLGYRVWLHNRVYWGHHKGVDLRWVHDAMLDLRCQLAEAEERASFSPVSASISGAGFVSVTQEADDAA